MSSKQQPWVPTPEEFLRMSLDEIAAINTHDLILVADVYAGAATLGAAALTTRERMTLKSCVRVILNELKRRSSTDDSLGPLLQKYLP